MKLDFLAFELNIWCVLFELANQPLTINHNFIVLTEQMRTLRRI